MDGPVLKIVGLQKAVDEVGRNFIFRSGLLSLLFFLRREPHVFSVVVSYHIPDVALIFSLLDKPMLIFEPFMHFIESFLLVFSGIDLGKI
jgi:hypothetical protein